MSASIGSILQSERESRGLSLAQAAEATRIQQARLRELENDDFSNFPNPAYARMYFRLYCKYLDIQLTDEIDLLFPGTLAGLDDYEYLRNEPVPKAKRTGRPPRPRRSLAIVAATLVVFLVVAAMIGASLYWAAQRVGDWGAQIQQTVQEKTAQFREDVGGPMSSAQDFPDATATAADYQGDTDPAPAPTSTPAAANVSPEVTDPTPTPPGEEISAAAMWSAMDGPAEVVTEDGSAPVTPEGETPAEMLPPPPGPDDIAPPPAGPAAGEESAPSAAATEPPPAAAPAAEEVEEEEETPFAFPVPGN